MKRSLAVMLLACFVLAAVCSPASAGKPPSALSILKGPYLQNVTNSSIVIMWQTNQASDSRVDYGLTSNYTNYVYDPASVTMHEVSTTGLATDSLYHYKVTSSTATETVSSADSTFETEVAAATPFRLGVYGDTRSQPAVHSAVVSAMIVSDPRIVLHTGDLVYDGRKDSYWQTEFFDPAQPIIRNTTLFPCLGNHEWNSSLYYQYFDPPDGGGDYNERWYSFDYANCHVAVIDTDASFSPGSAQYNWLASDLQSATAEWLFVVHHEPAYSSGSHGGTPEVQSYLVPLYEQYGVDMVFSGHDHLYERSQKSGIYYVVAGGGGAPLHDPNQHPNPYQQYVEKTYHHCTLDISGTTATLHAIHNDGSVFDTVTMSHGPAPPVANFSGNPTSGTVPLTVMFTDLSTNNPTSWSWSFGDSGTSTAQNPSHQYTSTGQFSVSLMASNAYGSDDEVKSNYITVSAGGQPPVAQFVGEPTSGTVPLTVNFTDQSTNSPTSWSWNFGDGGSSTVQNPSHQYTSTGQFTVSLTATNQYGSDDEVKTNYITVTGGGGAQDYTCASATIIYGSLVSGDHTNTHASDDSYLVVNTVSVTGKQSTQIQYNFNTGLSSLSSLTITTEWRHQGTSTAQNQRASVYNFSTSSWTEVDVRSVLATSDTTVTIPVSNPSPYISASGEVRVKLWTGDVAKTAWTHYIDLVKITAAP